MKKKVLLSGSGLLLFIILILFMSGCESMSPINALQAKYYYEGGQYDKAIERATESVHEDPTNAGGWYWLGVAYYAKHNYDEAISSFKKVIEINPVHLKDFISSSYTYLGWAYHEKGQFQEALNSFKQAISLNPIDSNNFGGLSRSYYKLKQYDDAITAAKRAIELDPNNAYAYNHLGNAYFRKKQFKEALNAYQKAIEINPKDPVFYSNIGNLFFEKKDYTRAADHYKKAVELDPKNPYALAGFRVSYMLMGRYDDALASVNKAIELQTFTGVGLNISIEDRYPVVKEVIKAGPAEKAGIEVGDKIIKIDGKSTKKWKKEQIEQSLRGALGTQVTLTLERKGIDKPFEKLVTRETIFDKSAAVTLGIRSLIHRYKGNQVEALKDAEKAFSLNSADEWVLLSLGASYLDRGNYQEAIKLLAQVKDSPTARILEATAYAKQGNMKEAVNIYSSIPEEQISPKNIPLMNDRKALLQIFKPLLKEHRDRAMSFASKGQYKEALSELSTALKIADETDAQEIQETMFSIIRKNPLLSEMPEDARKHALRGEILIKEGKFEQAVTEFKKAIQIAPYIPSLYYNLALINAELKKYPEAIRNMKIYLKAAPDAPDARAAKDEIIKWEFIMERENK